MPRKCLMQRHRARPLLRGRGVGGRNGEGYTHIHTYTHTRIHIHTYTHTHIHTHTHTHTDGDHSALAQGKAKTERVDIEIRSQIRSESVVVPYCAATWPFFTRETSSRERLKLERASNQAGLYIVGCIAALSKKIRMRVSSRLRLILHHSASVYLRPTPASCTTRSVCTFLYKADRLSHHVSRSLHIRQRA